MHTMLVDVFAEKSAEFNQWPQNEAEDILSDVPKVSACYVYLCIYMALWSNAVVAFPSRSDNASNIELAS